MEIARHDGRWGRGWCDNGLLTTPRPPGDETARGGQIPLKKSGQIPLKITTRLTGPLRSSSHVCAQPASGPC